MKRAFLLVYMVLLCTVSFSDNLRVFDCHKGLSSMFVLSLFQDHNGYMWAGTYDGLNLLSGSYVKSFGAGHNGKNQLSGNLIEQIHEESNGLLWVHTNLGFDRFDISNGLIEYHPEINGSYKSAVSPSGEIIALKGNNCYYYYNQQKKRFYKQSLKSLNYKDIQRVYIDDKHNIIIFAKHSTKVGRITAEKDGAVKIKIYKEIKHQSPVLRTSIDVDVAFQLTENAILYQTNIKNMKTQFVCRLPDNVFHHGKISCIVRDADDLLIGYSDNGMIRMKYNPMVADHFTPIDLGLSVRVYDIKKDKRQDIIWIATDGDGVFCYMREDFTFNNFPISSMGLRKPLRAIYKDNKNRIWLGTKGDGIVLLPAGLSTRKEQSCVIHYTAENSSLQHNTVYCFSPSKRNLFWIGTDGGMINYYSLKDNKIHTLANPKNQPVSLVVDVIEVNKNELWVATGGYGVFKLTLSGSDDTPVLQSAKQMLYDSSIPGKAQFCSIKQQGRYIWAANRENGIYKIDRRTGKTKHILLDSRHYSPLNDVLTLDASVPGKLFCGTATGLVELNTTNNHVKNINEEIHLGNCAIRGLLHAGQHIWCSTSHGLLLYNCHTGASSYYTSQNGIEAMEYCDRAAFFDTTTGTKYFGSTNELLTVSKQQAKKKTFNPEIRFFSVTVNGEEYSIGSLMKDGKFILDHDQNFFSVSFNALDYIYESDYTYYYRLKEVGDEWISNGKNRTIAFTNLSAGSYTLQVKYQKGNFWSNIYEQPFRILPPWYASIWAKMFYWFLFIAIIGALMRNYSQRQKRREQKLISDMEEKRKEEVYESKLSFFTNICHEFCTPLTLIGGPCQRLLNYERTDNIVKKYVSLIQRNSIRLNELIQELIEFRRVDTEHRIIHIGTVDAIEVTNEITESFRLLAEQKSILFNVNTEGLHEWNTDRSALTTIITNLVSNAFNYTPVRGFINVTLEVNSSQLIFSVENSGEGIKPADIDKVFNRYEIIGNLEQQTLQGQVQNEIGLATCQGLVHLLQGQIDVESTPGKTTCFKVVLPKREETTTSSAIMTPPPAKSRTVFSPLLTQDIAINEVTPTDVNPSRPTVVVVDDNEEILWFLHDYLSDSYNILTTSNPQAALDQIGLTNTALVITDIVVKPFDGIELCKRIKENESTRHIPVIILSAIHDDKQRIFAINAGADLYIYKPFDIDYLRTMVDSLLRRNNTMKEYYSSSLSVFEIVKGRMLHKEDKALLGKMLQVINENITSSELSTKFVADKMGLSVRNLYRRLETITDETPATIIKNARLERARQLITTTGHTMEEVCYKAGFGNRGTFYKLFMARYGCTPKQYHVNQKEYARNTLRY